MNEELIRLVDSLHRDKGIAKEQLFTMIEIAIANAAGKRFEAEAEVEVSIDRVSGKISAYEDGKEINPKLFGRIAAQTAKQVIIQKVREAEQDVIFEDYEAKVGELAVGSVQRFEKGTLIVNLGKTEGIVPRGEQVFSENYRPGERIRAYVLEVKRKGQKVVIILSRGTPEFVKALFELEVPEIHEKIIEIKDCVREPGHKTKIAVISADPRVDCIGACVGVRGSRIRNIVDELNGEKIDIVRWSEAPDMYIRNALSPAEITAVELDEEAHNALVVVPEDQLSLAIGRRGQNVRLSAKLTGWHVDIMTDTEARLIREQDRAEMKKLPDELEGFDAPLVESLILNGMGSMGIIVTTGAERIAEFKGITEPMATSLVEYATRRAAEIDQERAEAKAQRARVESERKAALAAEKAAIAEAVGAGATSTSKPEAAVNPFGDASDAPSTSEPARNPFDKADQPENNE